MIKPNPIKYVCANCGAAAIWAPKSDCIAPDDLPPSKCAKCGCDELIATKLNAFEQMYVRLFK